MIKARLGYKFSGRISEYDSAHDLLFTTAQVLAPFYVTVPGGQRIPQYAPTITDTNIVYAPQTNCMGYFTTSLFQYNNNCYNYSCSIATNSFAQPGRKHGIFFDSTLQGSDVVAAAICDGLILVGDASISSSSLQAVARDLPPGHFVALLHSPPDPSVSWPGDFHWVRMDFGSLSIAWSQKDGHDQVTNFDFAGMRIADPRNSNWTVNQGPLLANSVSDVTVSYQFLAWMFVPHGLVDII
jgi:hypothetical protein